MSLPPPAKIAQGLLFTLLVITAPVGIPLLLIGCYQIGQPEWRVTSLVNRAKSRPAEARLLLEQARTIDPNNAEALGALAEWHFAAGDFAGALPLATQYCKLVPSDWVARGHLAIALVQCNHIDDAIAELEVLHQQSPTDPDGKRSLVAYLAYAHLARGDPEQARALLSVAAGRSRDAGQGAQQCLYYLAVCDYLLGRCDEAFGELERLYALNPGYDGLQATKQAMRDGAYELPLPDGHVLACAQRVASASGNRSWERRPGAGGRCPNCGAPLADPTGGCPYCRAPHD